MSKNAPKTPNEPIIATTPAEPMSPGQQLRQAREARNITQEEIAKQLFVTKQIIADLEKDNYSNIVAPVYARGYLLSYARLLQISPQPLLDAFAKLTAHTKNNQPPMKILHEITTNPSKDYHRHWLSYVAAIIILVALVLWVYNHYQQITANKILEKAVSTTNINPIEPPTPNTIDIDNNKTITTISIPKTDNTQNTQTIKENQ